MVFSPQQVKFEFLSYIKEFGSEPTEWRVGCADDPTQALFARHAVDAESDIWLWKPTLSSAAARIVFRYLTEQLNVPAADDDRTGRCIFLFKRGTATQAATSRHLPNDTR